MLAKFWSRSQCWSQEHTLVPVLRSEIWSKPRSGGHNFGLEASILVSVLASYRFSLRIVMKTTSLNPIGLSHRASPSHSRPSPATGAVPTETPCPLYAAARDCWLVPDARASIRGTPGPPTPSAGCRTAVDTPARRRLETDCRRRVAGGCVARRAKKL